MCLPKLVCIVGTTAAGKSDLAVALALQFGGEVVSADSMQIYRGFDIGTAKITAAEMRGVAHHMLDVVPPDGAYSVADYCRDAERAVAGILSRGRLPVVAGGTGLYVDSLVGNTQFAGDKADPAYRASLQQYAREYGADALHAKLRAHDPEYAEKTHANNVKRVIRALELYRATGKTMAELAAQSKRPPRYECLKIGLRFADRQELYRRIDRRVDAMMARGLLQEVACSRRGSVPRRRPCRASATRSWRHTAREAYPLTKRSPASSRTPAVTPSASSPGFSATHRSSGSRWTATAKKFSTKRKKRWKIL